MLRKIITLLLLALIVGCEPTDIKKSWYEDHIKRTETVRCHEIIDGDEFIVAYDFSEKVKVGYRLDVTSESSYPLVYLISWRFMNDKGEHIGVNKGPDSIYKKSKIDDKRIYSEEILYEYIHKPDNKKISIYINLVKKNNFNEIQEYRNSDEEIKLLKICEL